MDGWSAYEKMVLDKLDGLEHGLEELRGEVVAVRIDVATLKVKAGIWGAVAGMVPAFITAVIAFTSAGN
ncbi:MAG TPA: hypothetical protein VLA89_06490 [Gemmatimonadales bacterium]|nr:hypothetical protein [Gemmatimonadales bacterium]